MAGGVSRIQGEDSKTTELPLGQVGLAKKEAALSFGEQPSFKPSLSQQPFQLRIRQPSSKNASDLIETQATTKPPESAQDLLCLSLRSKHETVQSGPPVRAPVCHFLTQGN